jgi:hypothetical protein
VEGIAVKSVILTTLLGNAVNHAQVWNDAGYYSDMPTALVHIVGDLDRYLQQCPDLPVIADPSCPGEDFNHRWDQERGTRTSGPRSTTTPKR